MRDARPGRQKARSLLEACVVMLADNPAASRSFDSAHWEQAIELLGDGSLPGLERWTQYHENEVRIAAEVAERHGIPTLTALAAAVGLTTDRYLLCERWSKRAFWSDLEILAAALCQRLPVVS